MSLSIGSVTASAISLTPVATASAQPLGSDPKRPPALAPQGDSVTLGQRALDYLRQNNPSLQAPGTNSSDAEKRQYQQTLATYAFGVQKADSITLNSKFQSYADTINNPNASDSQKLQAYSNYKVESVLADTSFSNYQSSDQDFKFEFLTRSSDFMQKANSGDLSSYHNQQDVAKPPNPPTHIDFLKSAAKLIDAGASLTSIQQSVIAINLVSTHLMFAIVNGNKASLIDDPKAQNINHTPGFVYAGQPVDAKTAIAEALAQSLQELNLSKVGASKSSSDMTYRDLFVQQVQAFAQHATAQVETSIQRGA